MKEWILQKVKEQGLAFAFMVVGLIWMNNRLSIVESKLWACYDSKEKLYLNRQQAQTDNYETETQVTTAYARKENNMEEPFSEDSDSRHDSGRFISSLCTFSGDRRRGFWFDRVFPTI
jgi:hypothetical protein